MAAQSSSAGTKKSSLAISAPVTITTGMHRVSTKSESSNPHLPGEARPLRTEAISPLVIERFNST